MILRIITIWLVVSAVIGWILFHIGIYHTICDTELELYSLKRKIRDLELIPEESLPKIPQTIDCEALDSGEIDDATD